MITSSASEQYCERRKVLEEKLQGMGLAKSARNKVLELADQLHAVQQGLAKVKPPSRGKGQ